MMKSARMLCILILFSLPVSAFAESLEIAVKQLFSQGKYKDLSTLTKRKAESDYKQARASLYPSVSLSTPFSWSDALINRTKSGDTTVDVEGSLLLHPTASLAVQELLPSGGSLSASLEAGYQFSDISSVSPSAFSSVYDLDPDSSDKVGVSLSFLQPIFTEPFYSVLMKNISSKKKAIHSLVLEEKNRIIRVFVGDSFLLWSEAHHLNILKLNYESSVARSERFKREKTLGMRTDKDLLAAEVETEQAKLELEKGEAKLERLRKAFELRYGMDVPTFSKMPVWKSPMIEFKDVLSGNLELERLKAVASEARLARLKIAKELAPSVSISAGVSSDDTLGKEPYSVSLAGSASLGLTIFDAGNSKAKIDSAKAAEDQAKRAVDDKKIDLRSTFDDLSYQVRAYDKQRKLDEMSVKISKMDLEAEEKQLDKGLSTVFEVREKSLSVDTAQRNLWSHLVDYNLAVLDLYRLAGRSLMDVFTSGVLNSSNERKD